jgi:hypothetical protein
MKRVSLVLLALSLAGCLGVGMTPDQLRASAGMTTCTTTTSLYGKLTTVTTNTDDTRKGATSSSKSEITCGEAKLTIDNSVGTSKP